MIPPKLARAFEKVFRVDASGLTPSTSQDDIEGWDSVSHIELILTLEMEFGVQFRTSEFSLMTSIADILVLLAEKGGL